MVIPKLKLFGLAAVGLLLLYLFAENGMLSHQLSARSSELEAANQSILQLGSVNESNQQVIAALEAQRERDRLAMQDADMAKRRMETELAAALQQIEMDISDEVCASLPLRGADRWLYYHNPSGGNQTSGGGG